MEVVNKIKGLNFLITGGAGFIGSNLVEFLLANGAGNVRVLDNFSTGYKKNLESFLSNPSFELIEGDIRDLATCQSACENIDYVSHQAALGSVPRSIEDPITTNDVNINGFLNMLVAVRDHKVKRMVYAASSSTYGDSKILPKIEHQIGMPLSPYAVTKYVNELYAHVFALNYGIETIGLRYFNVYGPKQNPNGPYAAVIPLFIESIINDFQPKINGDGEQSRDFTFIDNVIQANVKALFVEDESALNTVYNVAVGESITLNNLIEKINKISKKDVKPIFGPNRVGDVRHSLANIDKAVNLLGYKPTVFINEGLQSTFLYFKDN